MRLKSKIFDEMTDSERQRIALIEAMDANMLSFRAAKELIIEINGEQKRLSDLVFSYVR